MTRGDAYGFETGYVLVDARVAWSPNEKLEASLGVDNVTGDQAYVYSPLAQRTGYAGVKLRF
jgi:outer membrane receptor protein involved in Fe transport